MLELTEYVQCRWRPTVCVTRYIGSSGRQRWWRLSKVSNANNLGAVQTSRRYNRQLWSDRCRLIIDCHLSIVDTCTWVEPSHDWHPVAAVRNTTRHDDDVILLHGSRGWQIRWTARVSVYTSKNPFRQEMLYLCKIVLI